MTIQYTTCSAMSSQMSSIPPTKILRGFLTTAPTWPRQSCSDGDVSLISTFLVSQGEDHRAYFAFILPWTYFLHDEYTILSSIADLGATKKRSQDPGTTPIPLFSFISRPRTISVNKFAPSTPSGSTFHEFQISMSLFTITYVLPFLTHSSFSATDRSSSLISPSHRSHKPNQPSIRCLAMHLAFAPATQWP